VGWYVERIYCCWGCFDESPACAGMHDCIVDLMQGLSASIEFVLPAMDALRERERENERTSD
jgi:hypothetical protein